MGCCLKAISPDRHWSGTGRSHFFVRFVSAWLISWVCLGIAVYPASAQETATSAVVESANKPDAPPASKPAVDLKQIERKAQEVYQRVMPAVVSVDNGGSGVVVTPDGFVLTVAHVGMRSGRGINVTFPDGRSVRGRTLGNDHSEGNDTGVDAGLIKLHGDGPFPFVPMGKSGTLVAGTWCLALGYPVWFERGKPPALRIGRVQRTRTTEIVTDCTIMGGDSGGPLFDLEGNLIGIGSRCDDRLNVNIHVPMDCYHRSWDRLVKGEDFDSLRPVIAYLGVGSSEGSAEARIGRVFEDSSAALAGIQVGDIVVRFAGQEVSRYSDLPPLIEKRKPGDEVEIEVRRGEAVHQLKAKLGQIER